MRRRRADIWAAVQEILERLHVKAYLKAHLQLTKDSSYKQVGPGRPGPETQFRRVGKRRWDLTWELDSAKVAYDAKSDGMYPLLTNDRTLKPYQVLEAHKRQPNLEKRFEQLKTVHEIAPVFLKNEGRIEAFFTIYFLALLVQALIERDVRLAMKQKNIESLPVYGEGRECKRPTSLQILRLFLLAERHIRYSKGRIADVFDMNLTPLQERVLRLLRVPASAFVPA